MIQDRKQAGLSLAKALQPYKNENPVILALPRGGVPVAAEIATELGAPLDVLLVRKIGAPFNREFALGAICEDSAPVFSHRLLMQLELEPEDLGMTIEAEKKEISRQRAIYRQGRALPGLNQRTVILVDDGLATGATVLAAIEYLKSLKVKKMVIAVPVAAADSAQALRPKVHELVTLEEHENFRSVRQWYQHFDQVSDEEVLALLQSKRLPPVKQQRPTQ